MKQMTLALTMGQAIQGVRPYDGINYPLKDFIQDVTGSAEELPQDNETKKRFLAAVLKKLRGQAKSCAAERQPGTLKDLFKVLKERFAPGHDYAYFAEKTAALQMKQGESVGSFYDRIYAQLNAAKNALKDANKDEEITADL